MSDKKSKQTATVQRRNVFMMDPDAVTVVGHDTEDGVDHVLYDPRIKLPLDEGLVRNIQVYGVLEPIIGQTDGDRTLVVDGRRRVLHAREARKRQKAAGEQEVLVPVWFKKGEDQYLFGVSRSANAMRKDDGPISNARSAQRMIDMGASEAEVAVVFGVKLQTLKSWTNLLDLAPRVKAAVERGAVGVEAANALVGLSKEDQDAHVIELQAQGVKLTAEALTNRVRAAAGKPPSQTPRHRLNRATEVLTKLAKAYGNGGDLTEDVLLEAVEELCRAVLSKSLGRLAKDILK